MTSIPTLTPSCKQDRREVPLLRFALSGVGGAALIGRGLTPSLRQFRRFLLAPLEKCIWIGADMSYLAALLVVSNGLVDPGQDLIDAERPSVRRPRRLHEADSRAARSSSDPIWVAETPLCDTLA
jgi:hypothetical protein